MARATCEGGRARILGVRLVEVQRLELGRRVKGRLNEIGPFEDADPLTLAQAALSREAP